MERKHISGLVAAVLLAGMSPIVHAEVAEKAKEAKDATVQAAKKTGEAVGDAASTAVTATKKAAHKTGEVAVEGYHKGKEVTKKAVGTVAGKTKEVAGKVEDSMKK